MPKQGKTPKKKSKEKTPQKSGESEYPAMDQDEYNRLLQNAVDYAQAKLEQKHEEHIKALEADRDAKMGIMTEAVVAANNASLHTQKPYIPKRFLDLLEEHKYNPYIRGDAHAKHRTV